MSKLRIISISLAVLALVVIVLDWLGIIGSIDKVALVFPLLLGAIVLNFIDRAKKRKK